GVRSSPMHDDAKERLVGPVKNGEQHPCASCGSPLATAWSTTEGRAWLCRECANLHGLGCP
ncbi:MAG: hypothetical protein ACO28P_10110, partial [Ilumatobacteraceae bacterium]